MSTASDTQISDWNEKVKDMNQIKAIEDGPDTNTGKFTNFEHAFC